MRPTREMGLAPHLDRRDLPQFGPVTSVWCFQCGSEYEAGATEVCLECGVGLVDTPPIAADDVGDVDEEQLAYEFHDWAFESRRLIDQLLTGETVAHAWQGATLIIRAEDEDRVDQLVEQVEHSTLPTLDPDREHSVYEMAGWSDAQQTSLSRQLGVEAIAHEFDVNGDLVIHAEDEERLDEILDVIDQEGLVDVDADDDDDEAEDDDDEGDDEDEDDGDDEDEDDGDDEHDPAAGLDTTTLLNRVFDASDRLRKNARDAHGVLGLYDFGPAVMDAPMPYGYERPEWRGIVDLVRTVLELLDNEDSNDVEICEQAGRLRGALVTRL
jgi:hypothetical protein